MHLSAVALGGVGCSRSLLWKGAKAAMVHFAEGSMHPTCHTAPTVRRSEPHSASALPQ